MAEPRKVQFVTLSAFAPGSGAESRKRRLEENGAGFNFARTAEVEAMAAAGAKGKPSDRDKAGAERRATVRLDLCLSEPDDLSSAEFNYGELIQHRKNKSSNQPSAPDPTDPFNDDDRERLEVEALAKKFENKYGNDGKKKRKDRMQDLIDIGFGYDETDPFIDNSEAYDELVPASLTTKLGGFYINTGTLQFRAASDSEGEEDKKPNDKEQVVRRRRKKEVTNPEEKSTRKNKVPKQGLTALRPEKKKRKKLMKDSLYLAAMLRRFSREKEDMRKRTAFTSHPGFSSGLAYKSHSTNSTNHLLTANPSNSQGNVANDLSLADLTSDPAVMSLLGSANEKELQDLLGDLDFSLLDSDQARENGILGVGSSSLKGGGQGRSLFSPPPLPDGLPAPLIKRIEDLRAASRQFDQEGRKKFFTLDMNNILLDIELQVQEQPPELRADIYSHLEAFVPCNKEALLKRLKKLSLNIQDDRMRTPLLKLKLAVCSVMPEQIARYNMDCMAKAAKQQSEEGEKNGSDDEDEEKPGKRVMGPRKKFVWDDKLRALLCSMVRVKLSCYEMEPQCSLSVEDYLKAFFENEVKPLWPKGWMQARSVHCVLTESGWIQKPALTGVSPMSLSSAAPRQLPSASEPICLSDSLDEDLTAPSLDSISHALALLSNASKGLCSSESPLSPPPLQMPTSSPPPIAPHYPPAQQSQAKTGALPLGSTSFSSSSSPRHVVMASPTHRQGLVMGSAKMHPHPSPSPPKQRPPPTASPLLPPQQRVFTSASVVLGSMGSQALIKSTTNGSVTPASSPSTSRSNVPHLLQSFCAPSPRVSSPSVMPTSHSATIKAPQPNFITPMQATLTKASHTNASPIIKLTPRPAVPTPPPSPSHITHHSLPSPQQYSPKPFRPTFTVPGGKQAPGSSSIINNNSNRTPPPTAASPSANHMQRSRAVGGTNQSSKASATGSSLLGNSSNLPLGFGMLGGLVSMPFQFPPLLNFSPSAAPGAAGIGSTPSSNSGYPLAQNDLMGEWTLYRLS
uniref:Ubinuclein 2a n=1 Tax=Neogobius melanostomus TaxID=47308 RepID=A0A8C6T353_9GOBI